MRTLTPRSTGARLSAFLHPEEALNVVAKHGAHATLITYKISCIRIMSEIKSNVNSNKRAARILEPLDLPAFRFLVALSEGY